MIEDVDIPAEVRFKVHGLLETSDLSAWTGWTIQGLGMLRAYVTEDKVWRLHIWTSQAIYSPTPSRLHTHPWDFRSWTLAGQMRQRRFVEVSDGGLPFKRMQIQCGANACMLTEPEAVLLYPMPDEIYDPGDSYWMYGDEIHDSFPVDGTVTLIRRVFGADTERALVYYDTESWITAEPRAADPDMLRRVLPKAARAVRLQS